MTDGRPWVIEWEEGGHTFHTTRYATAADALDGARSLHRPFFRS